MKLHYIAIVLLTLLTLTGCSSIISVAPVKPISAQEQTATLINHINASTVALVTMKDNHIKPFCTGVWVDDNIIITASHCVQAAYDAVNPVENNSSSSASEDEEEDINLVGTRVYYIIQGEVDQVGLSPFALHASDAILADKDRDIAVLYARGKAIPPHEIATLATKMPMVGETVHIVGHVQGFYWTYIKGTLSSYRPELPHRQGSFIQISAPVYFGNSGGGAFTDQGELIGIASFIVKAPNTSMFIHLDTIRHAIASTKPALEIKVIKIEIK